MQKKNLARLKNNVRGLFKFKEQRGNYSCFSVPAATKIVDTNSQRIEARINHTIHHVRFLEEPLVAVRCTSCNQSISSAFTDKVFSLNGWFHFCQTCSRI